MSYFDITGWIGTLLFILGATAIANRSTLGFWLNGTANILYLLQSMIRPNIPLLVVSIFLICINIYGLYNWRPRPGRWKLGKSHSENFYRS